MRYNPNVNESNLNVQSILFENKCSISNSTDSYIAHRQKVRVILVTNESGYYSISLTLAGWPTYPLLSDSDQYCQILPHYKTVMEMVS